MSHGELNSHKTEGKGKNKTLKKEREDKDMEAWKMD